MNSYFLFWKILNNKKVIGDSKIKKTMLTSEFYLDTLLLFANVNKAVSYEQNIDYESIMFCFLIRKFIFQNLIKFKFKIL